MRRMNTQDSIIEAVNQGIESGEIEVGGGLPEIEEGDAGKVLKVNEAEDGVEWGEAGGSGGDNVLVVDFNRARSITIDTDTAANITNNVYDSIVIRNYAYNKTVLVFHSIVRNKISNIKMPYYPDLYYNPTGTDMPYLLDHIVGFRGDSGSYGAVSNTGLCSNIYVLSYGYIQLSGTTLGIHTQSMEGLRVKDGFRQAITASSGTLSSTQRPEIETGTDTNKGAAGDICFSYQISNSPEQFVYLRCISYDYTAKKMILQGNWVNYDTGASTLYTMKLDMNTGAYTITSN